MTRTGKLSDRIFIDTAGHHFALDELIGRDDESGVYDTSVIAAPKDCDPRPGDAVVIEDREDCAVMCW